MKTLYGCLILWTFLYCGCTTTSKVSNQNLATIYKASTSLLHPQYLIYHFGETTSTVYFTVDASELLYIKRDNSTTTAKLSFTYIITESFDAKAILDSGSVVLSDINTGNNNKWITGNFTVRADYGKTYLAEITLRDLNRISVKKDYLNIDKSAKSNRQDFLILNTENNAPLFRNYVDADETINIRHTNKEIQKLWISYFNRNFPLPAPPFSSREFEPFVYKADSIFSLPITDSLFNISFNKKGFYHIQTDTSNKLGLTVYCFEADFPFVKTPEHLLEPLRYLTSKNEFLTMSNYKNKKLAVDSFWIHCGGNQTKGKELIRKFYGRMQEANKYFTSYLEGWKSDRGLIYLIYGQPQYLYKTGNLEVWSYDSGASRGRGGLTYMSTFTFVKVINPFTDNDYRLERNLNFKENWYMAIESWRLGQVFSDY